MQTLATIADSVGAVMGWVMVVGALSYIGIAVLALCVLLGFRAFDWVCRRRWHRRVENALREPFVQATDTRVAQRLDEYRRILREMDEVRSTLREARNYSIQSAHVHDWTYERQVISLEHGGPPSRKKPEIVKDLPTTRRIAL